MIVRKVWANENLSNDIDENLINAVEKIDSRRWFDMLQLDDLVRQEFC